MQDVLATAIGCHRSGQLETAARLYRQVLAQAPDTVAAMHNLGMVLQAAGGLEEAAQLFARELQLQPDDADAHHSLASVLRRLGRPDEALAHFQRAAELAPNDVLARGDLGQMLLSLGRPAEAVPHCREAARLQPNNAVLHLVLGDALRGAEQFEEARRAYRRAMHLQPALAQAHANLGLLFLTWNKVQQAFAPLERAVELEPANVSFWKYLAEARADWEEFSESARCWRRALALAPDNAGLHLGLAAVLEKAGQFDEAEVHVRTAMRLAPDSAAAHHGLGSLCAQQGDRDRAEAAFRTALRLEPACVEAQKRLVELLRGRASDADRLAIEERLADPALPEEQRVDLLFVLAAIRDVRGDHAGAADCARRANALALERLRRRGEYTAERDRGFVEGLVQTFGPEFFQRTAGAGLSSRRPVFIVGLPRSGTSLLEQVLASHSRVYGAGELYLARQTFAAIPKALGQSGDPLACVPLLDESSLRQLGEQHLARLAELDAGRADRIVDKLPGNYYYLGLLAALFPHATFIHCRRDLRDVAVSCWLNNFRWLEWTNDAGHIAAHFEQYQRLMRHWRRVLPVPLHEVVYEEVVEDLEGAARRLVAACGLDWEPACLEFHRTRRPVRTVSAAQVRTPIYRQSVGRWKHYEHELADLLARLPAREDDL